MYLKLYVQGFLQHLHGVGTQPAITRLSALIACAVIAEKSYSTLIQLEEPICALVPSTKMNEDHYAWKRTMYRFK